MGVHPLDIGGDAGLVAAGHSAELQILLDRDAQERAAPLRYMRDAEPHNVLGRPAGDRFAAKADFAIRSHHAAQRAQYGRLARTIGAKKRADMTLANVEADAVERLVFAVESVDASDLQHRRSGIHRPGLTPALRLVPR